jgi:hypothetical protein
LRRRLENKQLTKLDYFRAVVRDPGTIRDEGQIESALLTVMRCTRIDPLTSAILVPIVDSIDKVSPVSELEQRKIANPGVRVDGKIHRAAIFEEAKRQPFQRLERKT